MENKDLKDVFKTVKEKRRKEKMERILVYLSGVLLALVFVAVGLNFFSKQDKTVSEPDVKIVKDINQPVSAPVIQPSELPQPQHAQKEEVNIPSKEELQQTQPVKQGVVKQQEPEPEEKISPQKLLESDKNKQEIKKQEKKEAIQKQKEDKLEYKAQKPAKVHQDIQNSENSTSKDKEIVLSTISSGFFSIQVGAFSTREKAMQEKSKYSNAFIIEEGGLHKVLVGRFETDREAREYKNKHNIDGFVKRIRN